MEDCLRRMPDKEFNPKTCMFVKKCKEGEMRNESGKCVKKPKATPLRKTRRQVINTQSAFEEYPANKSPDQVKFNPKLNVLEIPAREKLRMRKRFTGKLKNPNTSRLSTTTRNSLNLARRRLPLMDEDSGLVFEQPSVNLNAPNKPRTRSRSKKPLFQALNLNLNNEPLGNYSKYAREGRRAVNELNLRPLQVRKRNDKKKKGVLNMSSPIGSSM